MLSNKRVGCFTSSEVYNLFTVGRDKKSPGKPYMTYVTNKNRERLLGRSIQNEVYSKPTQWGKILEAHAFDILPLAYTLNSDETIEHPSIKCLVGSPDGFKLVKGAKETVVDIKCPYTLQSFCELVEPLRIGLNGIEAMQYLRDNHDSGDDYYYQLISNACITGCGFAELIVYMPYERELADIKLATDGNPSAYFISMAQDGELPYLIEGGVYKNVNIIRFEVTDEMKKDFEAKVIEAGKLLTEPQNQLS